MHSLKFSVFCLCHPVFRQAAAFFRWLCVREFMLNMLSTCVTLNYVCKLVRHPNTHTTTLNHSLPKVHVYINVLVPQDFCANYDNGEEPAAGGNPPPHTHTLHLINGYQKQSHSDDLTGSRRTWNSPSRSDLKARVSLCVCVCLLPEGLQYCWDSKGQLIWVMENGKLNK